MENKTLIEQYTQTLIWQILTSYIVIMFIQEIILEKFLINFSIDLIVAVVALFILIINLKIQFKILNNLQVKKDSFIFGIVSMVFALFAKLITINNPYDFSFLILVIGIITCKKILLKKIKDE